MLQQFLIPLMKSLVAISSRAKLLIYSKLQKYAFITVLLYASIPHPHFDLAGITCGHFKVLFKTYFSQTFIGEAIISIYSNAVLIIMLRKRPVEYLIAKIKQKKLLFSIKFLRQQTNYRKDMEYVLIVMISYFVIRIIKYFSTTLIDRGQNKQTNNLISKANS